MKKEKMFIMWKIFFNKKNILHPKEKDLCLFIFNELEDNVKLSEVKNHLSNCDECKHKYIVLKRNIEFLISNKNFLKKENVKYSSLISNGIMWLFTKKGLGGLVIFSCFFVLLFFINYFNSQRIYYAKEEEVAKLISLHKSIDFFENNLESYDRLSLEFEDYFYEFENLFEID